MGKTETALDSITCPGCGEVIPISETIYHQVAERAERELKAKSVRQERALAQREKQLQAREGEFERRVQEQRCLIAKRYAAGETAAARRAPPAARKASLASSRLPASPAAIFVLTPRDHFVALRNCSSAFSAARNFSSLSAACLRRSSSSRQTDCRACWSALALRLALAALTCS